ncbi:MAG TPA: hypothetical protein VGL78_18105 [Solirubrobacteraceae bacterium]
MSVPPARIPATDQNLRPALAGIMGSRLAWMVSMISVVSILADTCS